MAKREREALGSPGTIAIDEGDKQSMRQSFCVLCSFWPL